MRLFSVSFFATLLSASVLSAPVFAADLGTYRPGTPYYSTVAAGADVCDNQCAGDAQCRGWNYVKPNPRAQGVCEFLSSVSTPVSSQISISGESMSAMPLSSRVTAGGTNTIRVGTQPAPRTITTRVGQTPSGRRVVRQALPQQVQPRTTPQAGVENMSLTEQQNLYRNGQSRPSAKPAQAQTQPIVSGQRPVIRPILDGPSRANVAPQVQQPQIRPSQVQSSRRMTGPRRIQTNQNMPMQQFKDPRYQAGQGNPTLARPQMAQPQTQRPPQMMHQGAAKPPIGQPIPATQLPRRPQPTTPGQRLAQFKAQTQAARSAVPPTGPIALSPQQAQKSLFGRLNDDVATTSELPTAQSVPTQPVSEQPLDEVLAGGL